MLHGSFPPFRTTQPVTPALKPNLMRHPYPASPVLAATSIPGNDCLELAPLQAFNQAQNDYLAKLKQQTARQLAEQFCNATIDRFGTDEKSLKGVLKEVHRLGVRPEFQAEVLAAARLRGKPFHQVSDVIEQEFAANPVEKWFKNAPRKECLDYWHTGTCQYRATAWDYRLNGMYRSLADFGQLCKKHPVMSTATIAAVATLGHLYPFWGAVSGLAIFAWSGVFSLVNEVKALKHPAMSSEKAAYYKSSGENLAALLLTLIGVKGIRHGTQNGMKAYHNTAAQATREDRYRPVATPLQGLWNATKARAEGEHKISATESALFVLGLFDNVLLPFNWVDDQLKAKRAAHKSAHQK